MTVKDLCSVLHGEDKTITVRDSEFEVQIIFNSYGWEQVSDAVLEADIKKLIIKDTHNITVKLVATDDDTSDNNAGENKNTGGDSSGEDNASGEDNTSGDNKTGDDNTNTGDSENTGGDDNTGDAGRTGDNNSGDGNNENIDKVAVSAMVGTVFGTDVSDIQDNVAIADQVITGTLKWLASGALVDRWGAGNFLAIQLGEYPEDATSIAIGMSPSYGNGLVEVINDPDRNGVFKVTDKDEQKFVVQISDGETITTQEYDLSSLTIEGEE